MFNTETKTATTANNLIQAKRQPFFNKEGQDGFFSESNETSRLFFSPTTIKPKLTIGQPNDKYEIEADAMADKVVQRLSKPLNEEPASPAMSTNNKVQAKCSHCEEEEKVQKKEDEELLQNKLEIQPKPIFESNAEQPEANVQTKPLVTPVIQARCSSCKAEEKLQKNEEEELSEPDGVQAKSIGGGLEAPSDLQGKLNASPGGGSPLPSDIQSSMGSEFGADFSNVRVHTGSEAVQMSQDIGAQAFTHGSDIYFNEGKYDTNSGSGKHLLAHELTHVVQQGGREKTIQKTDEEDAELERKVNSFKRLVKTTAQHRLRGNIRNLELWKILVEDNISVQDFNYIGLVQSNGLGPLLSLQDERNPAVRELRANQIMGRYRACTGCHYEVQARNWGNTQSQIGSDWMTPNELRTGQVAPNLPSNYRGFLDNWSNEYFDPGGEAEHGGETLSPEEVVAITNWINQVPATSDSSTSQSAGAISAATMDPVVRVSPSRYNPNPASTEGRINTMYPNPDNIWEGMEKVMPILNQLGPDGYDVLPADIIHRASNGRFDGIRESIQERVDQRIENYNELIELIGTNEVDYEHFAPIIRDLLPLADIEVRDAIQEEMDDNAFWAKVEMVFVGLASVAALLMTIFPPTSVLGVATLATLEVGLGLYGVSQGMEMMEVGQMYSLGRGADNVFTEEQQRMGDAMVLGGFISVIGGYLSFRSGWMRSMGIAPRLLQEAMVAEGALVRATPQLLPGSGNTFQQGKFVFSLLDDGAVVATILDDPNLMIIVRDNIATLYQRMGGGGLRVVASSPIPAGVTTSGALATTTPAALALPGSTGLPPYLLRPGTSPVTPLLPGSGPLLLTDGNPTSLTLRQVRNLRGQQRWQSAEIYAQELTGSPGQQHFPVPATGGITGTGGRFVDSPVALPGGGTLANEVKMYQSWTTVNGSPVQQFVPNSAKIQQQILKDVWLRDNVPGYDPRWLFLDAPPSSALAQFLSDNNIMYIIYH